MDGSIHIEASRAQRGHLDRLVIAPDLVQRRRQVPKRLRERAGRPRRLVVRLNGVGYAPNGLERHAEVDVGTRRAL